MAEKKHNGYGDGQNRTSHIGPDGTDTGQRTKWKDPYSRRAHSINDAGKFPSRVEIAKERARGIKR